MQVIWKWLLSWGLEKLILAIKDWYLEYQLEQERGKKIDEAISEYKKAVEAGDEQAQRDAHKRLVNKLQ
jgi:hypothetical protein